MSAVWYYGTEDDRHGPYSAQQLQALAAAGTIRPTDTVWKEGVAQGVAAIRVKNLFNPRRQISLAQPRRLLRVPLPRPRKRRHRLLRKKRCPRTRPCLPRPPHMHGTTAARRPARLPLKRSLQKTPERATTAVLRIPPPQPRRPRKKWSRPWRQRRRRRLSHRQEDCGPQPCAAPALSARTASRFTSGKNVRNAALRRPAAADCRSVQALRAAPTSAGSVARCGRWKSRAPVDGCALIKDFSGPRRLVAGTSGFASPP
jgi:hypothetical protein